MITPGTSLQRENKQLTTKTPRSRKVIKKNPSPAPFQESIQEGKRRGRPKSKGDQSNLATPQQESTEENQTIAAAPIAKPREKRTVRFQDPLESEDIATVTPPNPIPRKRGRPKGSKNKTTSKTNNPRNSESDSSNSTDNEASDEDSDSSTEGSSDHANGEETPAHAQSNSINHSKEGILYRKGNIVYFIDTQGQPLDKAARQIKEKGLFIFKENAKTGEVIRDKINRRKFWGLCLSGNESIVNLKTQIRTTFTALKNRLNRQTSPQVNLAVTDVIANVPWSEILTILIDVFKDSTTKPTLCHDSLIYVSDPNERDKIFQELHAGTVNGHKGLSKTYNRIRQKYFWENLRRDLQKRIQFCLPCQIKKLVRIKTRQEMVITDTPATAFEKISMDFVGPLPRTKRGHEYILTVQDNFSKFAIATPTSDMLATTVADILIGRIFCTFGAPKLILSDQGQNFMASLMKCVAKRFKVKNIRTTAYHPESNGSLERWHATLVEYLKQYTCQDEEWDLWLDLACFSFNTSVSESSKYTPFELVFGKLAPTPSERPLSEQEKLPTYKGYMTDLVRRLTETRKLAHDNLLEAKLRSKYYYDRKAHPQQFEVGSFVYLCSGPKPGK